MTAVRDYPLQTQNTIFAPFNFKTRRGFFVSLQSKNNCSMPNPTTKQELLAAMADGCVQLNEQKGYYKNTYTTSMAAYFLSVTPYGQAVKILKAHQKNLKKK